MKFTIKKKEVKKEAKKEGKTAEDLKKNAIKNSENSKNVVVNEVIDYLLEHPDEAAPVLQMLIDTQKIPNEIFRDVSVKMSNADDIPIPNSAIVDAVKNSDSNVPDKIISDVLKDGDFETETAGKLIEQIDSSNIKKENIKGELVKLYGDCLEYSSDEDLLKALGELGISGKAENEEINNAIKKIIARRMALNFAKFGFSKVFVYEKYLSPEEMLQEGLSKDIIHEYEKLDSSDFNGKEIDETDVTSSILEAIARDVAKKFQETGNFIIPQSKAIANISLEEEDQFIKEIENKSKKELSNVQILNIKDQIREKIKDKEEETKIIEEIYDSGLIDLLGQFTPEKRKEIISSVTKVVQERASQIEKEDETSRENLEKSTNEVSTKPSPKILLETPIMEVSSEKALSKDVTPEDSSTEKKNEKEI